MGVWYQSLCYALINTCYYASIIYGNISILYPRFYEKSKNITYGISVFLMLVVFGLARTFLMALAYNAFTPHPEKVTASIAIYYSLAGIMIFLLSFIVRIALAYFGLKQQNEQIIFEKTLAQLDLLKSQVQPHFLFNTLNNIYYEAFMEAPKTAFLIERLSGIVRYFIDESPKPEVFIDTEVKFLENYIELEKIRTNSEIAITFVKDYAADAKVPPMLMMAFVENIFKHGIDRESDFNAIQIFLIQKNDLLTFKTKNHVYKQSDDSTGFGLKNLRKRLSLLYNDKFELTIEQSAKYFDACFKIPVT